MTMDQWQRDIVAAREKVKKLEAARDALAEQCLALQQELDDRIEACAKRCEEAGPILASGVKDVWHVACYHCADAIREMFDKGIEPQTKGESHE